MARPRLTIGCMLIACLMALGMARAEALTTRPVSPDPRIAEMIALLGDPSIEVRDKASAELRLIGRAAEEALLEATRGDDPEAAARAREILSDFKWGLYPDTPADVAELIRRYRRGNQREKQVVVRMLAARGAAGYPVLARLSMAEPDNNLRSLIFAEIARQGLEALPALLDGPDAAAAEQVLEMAIADGSERGCRTYAAYYLHRGRIDEKIDQLRQQLDVVARAAGSAKTLAYLYRAKGELDQAKRMAERSGDDLLLEQILFEQADYRELARRRAGDLAGDDIERLGYLAAFWRLSGDQAGLGKTLDQLRKQAAGDGADTWYVGKALLLNSRTGEAIDLFLKNGQLMQAAELLALRHEYRRAIETAEKSMAAGGADAPRLRTFLARQLHTLGQNERALKLFEESRAWARQSADASLWVALIAAERQCHLMDRAMEHAAEAVTKVMAGDGARAVLEAVFEEQAGLAGCWWQLFARKFPKDTPLRQLHRVREVVEKNAPVADVEKWAEEMIAADAWEDPDRRKVIRAAAETLEAYGKDEAALKAMVKLAELNPGTDDVIDAANLAAKLKKWTQAAELYGRINSKDAPASLYLRGYALTQSGNERAGRELMEKATLLPLADDRQRYRLASLLEKAGLKEAARYQYRLLARTGEWNSWEMGAALRSVAHEATLAGDYATAAECWERSMLGCLDTGTSYVETVAYLQVPALVHKLRARAMLKAGKPREAMAQIDQALRVLPADITVAIEFVPMLKSAGAGKEGEQLVQRLWDGHKAVLAEYPRSALIHNSAAWLLGRCRMHLDAALMHAQKGVELDPGNCAILDTLAEVHFQRGEKDKAIEQIKRCIALEPNNGRHKLSLERFERANPDTPPPAE